MGKKLIYIDTEYHTYSCTGKSTELKRQRYWATLKRAMVTVQLQDGIEDYIEMEEYPYKKSCHRLFTD